MEERLQKVLAAAGVASRREAEKFITGGRVKVNGKLVTELGVKVNPRDQITVDDKQIRREHKVYRLFYKPRGVVTTMKDPEGRQCIADFVQDLKERVYPVGRLDYNTEGLLLLTNDGALAQTLTHPSHEFGKSYEVTVLGIVPQEKLDKLRIGVNLEDGVTAPAVVTLRSYDTERGLTNFEITIHEGRNRQVRRMCDYIGYPVRKLMRTKMGPLNLKGLRRGDSRELDEFEVTNLLEAAGLNSSYTEVPVTSKKERPRQSPVASKKAVTGTPSRKKTFKKVDDTNAEKRIRNSHRRAGGRR